MNVVTTTFNATCYFVVFKFSVCYICTYMRVRVCTHVCTFVYKCVHVCKCTCSCVGRCVCMCVCAYMWANKQATQNIERCCKKWDLHCRLLGPYISISERFYTSKEDGMAYTYTHSLTHTLIHTHTHTLTLTLSHTHSLSHSLSHTDVRKSKGATHSVFVYH